MGQVTLSGKYPELKLPEEIIDELIQLAHTGTENDLRLGDVCVMLIDGLSTVYPKHFIRSRIATESGLATETLRSREWVSRNIPVEKRIYPFTFHQYRACLAAGEQWEKYAQKAIEEMENYNGRIAPVAVIRSWITKSPDEIPPWRRKIDRIKEIAESVLDDTELPAKIKYILGMLLDA